MMLAILHGRRGPRAAFFLAKNVLLLNKSKLSLNLLVPLIRKKEHIKIPI